jgi:hypothetical protein
MAIACGNVTMPAAGATVTSRGKATAGQLFSEAARVGCNAKDQFIKTSEQVPSGGFCGTRAGIQINSPCRNW